MSRKSRLNCRNVLRIDKNLTFLGVKRCQLSVSLGRCRAVLPHYYYDKKAKKCKIFAYGGCGGNENRFKTKKECEKACKGV